MEPTERLTATLTEESKAYGYTLTIWGGGAILITEYGTPDVPAIFLYVAGALTAFAVLATLTFQSLFARVSTDPENQQVVASMVHFVASFANLLVSYGVVRAVLGSGFPDQAAFFSVGFQATLAYNLLLLLEQAVARQVARFVPMGDY